MSDESEKMSEPVTKQELKEELHRAVSTLATKDEVSKLATKDELASAVSKLATKEELASAVSKLATKDELREAVSKLATKDALNDAVGALLAMIQNLSTQVVANTNAIQALSRELAGHASALRESMSSEISVVDEKYKDLPSRVSRLEQASARRK
jgi:hypothetical protein